MTGLSVHSICKSSSLTKSLNRIGVTISYRHSALRQVQRIRTRLASYTVESSNDNVPLPSHFHPDKFTIAAFDNFDHNEATESGINSTHDTVSVLFQEESETFKNKPKLSETGVNKRCRTFNNELQCQNLKHFQTQVEKLCYPLGRLQMYYHSTKIATKK